MKKNEEKHLIKDSKEEFKDEQEDVFVPKLELKPAKNRNPFKFKKEEKVDKLEPDSVLNDDLMLEFANVT